MLLLPLRGATGDVLGIVSIDQPLHGRRPEIGARILAVADAYEAMIANRPYRAGMPAADAREEIVRCAGTQFDAGVVDAFLAALEAGAEALAAEAVA